MHGTMRKCCKSDLLKEPERDLAVVELEETDETILTAIDFMVLEKLICIETSKCNTFGDLSDALLKAVTSMFKCGSNVDVVCDRYDIKKSHLKTLKEFDVRKCDCKRSKVLVKAHQYLNKEANFFLIQRTSKISATLFLMIGQSRQDDF